MVREVKENENRYRWTKKKKEREKDGRSINGGQEERVGWVLGEEFPQRVTRRWL